MIKNYLHELNITGSQIDEKNVQKIIDLIEKTILKKRTIFVCGNIHKGNKHFKSKQITLQKQTRDINEIWSQVYPYLKKLFDSNKKH